ncbi:MAG: helix-turn-helix domain-containing protein [Bdellovibrionota bacterium]|nr:MAG: helix-turn-helix domain-containing protein [Bdellovibrionota bacterium]
MISQLCSSFGLSERERLVLEALSDHGVQPASRIARFCGLPRNTARTILDRLVTLGLLVRNVRAHTHFYELERRDALLRVLEYRRSAFLKEIDGQIAVIKKMGDALGSHASAGTKPRVTFYEGWQGLERVYEDTLTATDGICSWASFDENQRAMPKYFGAYYRRRAKRGIPMRSIHPDTPLARAHQKQDHKELRTSRLVPADQFAFRPEIQVYDDKVNIVSWKDRIGVIIQSRDIADALRSIFELSFQGAHHYAPKTRERKKARP